MLSKDFKEFVACLNARAVEYLIVGGYAVAWHGHPRHTGDLDVWVRRDAGNAARLMQALGDFGFGSLGLSPADFEGPQQVVQLGYPPFRIDLMTDIDGVDFSAAWPRRDTTQWDGLILHFIGLEDLKTNKLSTGRPRDLGDVQELP